MTGELSIVINTITIVFKSHPIKITYNNIIFPNSPTILKISANLKLLSFLQPLSGFSDGVFQEKAVWEVGRDARCLLSSSTKGLYGVWWSGG